MITPETTPLYYERLIAEKLGIPREALRAIRRQDLIEGEDYGQPARELVLSASGLLKLLALLKKDSAATVPEDADFSDCMMAPPEPPSASDTAPEKKEPGQEATTPSAADVLEFKVLRLYPNNRLLLCSHPVTGAATNVRVKNNENFRPGLRLKARWQPNQNAYVMEGRCPRYPGRY